MRPFYQLSLTLLLLLLAATDLRAQEQLPLDSLCVPFGQGFIANVLDDDFPAGQGFGTSTFQGECFFVDQRGRVSFNPDAREEICCGETFFFTLEVFRQLSNGEQEFIGTQPVELTIKCPKPECGIVDLTEIRPQTPTMGDEPNQPPPDCIQACENSTAIYLWPEDATTIQEWTAVNGVVTDDPAFPGQISVAWGDVAGGGSLSLTLYAADGVTVLGTSTWCVNLTPSPVADFTFTDVACLGQEVYFTNTSTGAAATYDWDFGDGNTAQNITNPSHSYTTAGTYTVTLYATSDGVQPDGSQACCCTDTISYDIEIDPLPGPPIYWISTLCEGDTSIYWTDADCDDYTWTVSGNGTPVGPLTGDTITVIWNSGPSGTLTLAVDNCTTAYCDEPSTAIVPIISTNGVISGPIEVCPGESANYELPKWLTVAYNWGASAGTINGSNTGHVINVTWPTAPGTYVLEADYGSDFLNGLPNHDGDDCYGTARLEVTVLGDFNLTASPNPACIYQSVNIFANSNIGVTTYDWSVAGYPGLSVTGASNFSINPGDVPGPGVYTVTALVNNPADYCVAEQSINIVLQEAISPVILGPADYCVGDPVVYTIASPAPGYTYNWTFTPFSAGSVDMGQGSPTATVTFNVTSGAILSVTGMQAGAPGCVSEPASVMPMTKELVATDVIGPAACTNSLADYELSMPQHADATYTWSVSPATAGSVVAGVNGPVATIQWNDDAVPVSITVTIELCGLTIEPELDLDLNEPKEPEIDQVGELCPGGSIFLYVLDSLDFDSFAWTLPQGTTGPATGGFTVSDPGDYVVNTIDENGCPGVARYRVEVVDGPEVTLSLDGLSRICVNNPDYPPFPANPVLTATTDAANTIEWFCNGNSQGTAATGNTTFTHVWNDTVKVYAYTAKVTDPNGCMETPLPIIIRQDLCCGRPYVTDPFPMLHDFTATRQDPDCDIVDLVANFSEDSVAFHGFELPLYTQVLSVGGDDDTDSMTIRLPGVGCFDIAHTLTNWAFDYDTVQVVDPVSGMQVDSIFKADSILCSTSLFQKVCNPLFAEFDFTELCGVVEFEDESLIDPTLVSGTVNYDWNFGDGNTGSGFPISHDYMANGTYTVTLTLSDDNCQSVFTLNVVVDDFPDSDYTFAPATVCAGEPITFTGSGSNVIEWEWDFDDGATFNGNGPQHTFETPGGVTTTYDVVLYTTNSAGCLDTVTKVITVFPTPILDTIEASNGLIICDGETTTLSVDLVAGYTYEWSTGATTNSINVSTAGTYDVTITTADDCERVIDAVEVQIIPLPDISWKGNPFICDNGSTTLMSLAGGGHDYEWTNLTNGGAIVGTSPSYTVNFFAGPPEQEIQLKVISQDYGCVAETIITVTHATSPAPIVGISGGICEGDGSTIFVTNPEADVVYTWNTGETGTSIFTYQAGTYTVIATNTISGCTGTDQAVIHPLPDLCSVPTGCYETCAPDTICAPPGDYSYAWYQNGNLVGSGQKLEVSESGSFSVTVFDNVTGCFASSDSLYLEVLNCDSTDCDDIFTDLKEYVNADGTSEGCCSQLIVGSLPTDIYAIQISSPDADLDIIPGTVDPFFGYANNAATNVIQLASDAGFSAPLPDNAPAFSALAFCPSNFIISPQLIIVEYLNADLEVVCSDTLKTECPVEPECIYVTRDTLTCADTSGLILTFEACVPLDATFDIGHIEVLTSAPGVMIDGITVSPAMMPGECRTFSVALPELTAGDEFCYTLVAHTADPDTNPDALCCSDGDPRCLTIPDCDPCDEIGFDVANRSDEGCCYDLFLVNNEDDFTFDGVDLCLINSSATLNVFSSLGDPVIGTVNAGGQTISYTSASGGVLPSGTFQVPHFCLEDSEVPETSIEIKWLENGKVICRDTFTVFCKPPCGYLEEELVDCVDGNYVWYGNIVSTSMFTMSSAHIKFDPALGLSDYDTTIVFTTPLNMGDAQFVELIFGEPIVATDSICFTVTLHELSDNDNHLNCCQFEACIELPDCELDRGCLCEDLEADVSAGINATVSSSNSLEYTFTSAGDLLECDAIYWYVRRVGGGWQYIGSADPITYTFPGGGDYEIALYVIRNDDNGVTCNELVFLNLTVAGTIDGRVVSNVQVYPNPAREMINVQAPEAKSAVTTLQLYNSSGQLARTYVKDLSGRLSVEPVQLDIRGLPSGVYLLRGEGKDGVWTTRFVKEK